MLDYCQKEKWQVTHDTQCETHECSARASPPTSVRRSENKHLRSILTHSNLRPKSFLRYSSRKLKSRACTYSVSLTLLSVIEHKIFKVQIKKYELRNFIGVIKLNTGKYNCPKKGIKITSSSNNMEQPEQLKCKQKNKKKTCS